MNHRAESLAARVEQGAAELAPCRGPLGRAAATPPRRPTAGPSAGSSCARGPRLYPIEIDLARAVGSGKAVTDVTWQAVAELNANHAGEYREVAKAAALDLLRVNSRQAAEAVRAFTDEELDEPRRSR